jgi:hypothetical protein
MGEFVFDEPLELIDGHVSMDPDPVEKGFADTEDAFRDIEQVGKLEIGIGLVIDERNAV